jgi:hypothetical protein
MAEEKATMNNINDIISAPLPQSLSSWSVARAGDGSVWASDRENRRSQVAIAVG